MCQEGIGGRRLVGPRHPESEHPCLLGASEARAACQQATERPTETGEKGSAAFLPRTSCFHPRLTRGEDAAQRGYEVCPRSQRQQGVLPRRKTQQSGSESGEES